MGMLRSVRAAILIGILLLAATVGWLALRTPAPPPPMAPQAERPAPPRPRQVLHWMGHWLGEDRRETLVREVAREFAFLHPEIDLDLRFPQELMGVRSKRLAAEFIVAQIRSERPDWDVVWLDDAIYQQVADILGDQGWGRKHLVDFLAQPGFVEAHKPFIVQDPAFAAQTGGVLVGPYIEGQYLALWINRDLAASLGIALPPDQPLWSDVLKLAAAVQAARAAGRSEVWLFAEAKDWLTSQFVFQSLVASRFPDQRRAMDETATPAKRAAVREAVRAFAELGRLQPVRPDHRELLWMDSRRLPLDDRVLCFIGGTWMYSHWRGLDAGRMARMQPLRLPVFAPVDHAVGGYIPTWAVLARAPAREAGIALLRHWCSADVAERWVAYTKNPTGLRGDLARVVLSDDPFDRFMVGMEASFGSRVSRGANPAYALGPQGAVQANAFHEVLRGLLVGELTADQGWERLCSIAGWDPAAP